MKVDDSPITANFQGYVPEGMGIYCHLWAYDLYIYIYIRRETIIFECFILRLLDIRL